MLPSSVSALGDWSCKSSVACVITQFFSVSDLWAKHFRHER